MVHKPPGPKKPESATPSGRSTGLDEEDEAPSKAFFYGTVGLISIVLALYFVCRLWDQRGLRGMIWGPLSWICLGYLVAMMFLSLYKVQAVAPGFVTRDTKIDVTHERKSNGSLRYCRKTGLFKPDRAHYCHTTKKLIMRFDHHCIFLNASIGLQNHRYFILFLVYAAVGSALVAIDTLVGSAPFSIESKFELSGEIYLVLFIVFVLGTALSISLGGFCAYHLYLAVNGWTTIESSEQQGFDPRTGRKRMEKPYALPTLRENLEQIMGTDLKTWLLPYVETRGLPDGVHWKYQGLNPSAVPSDIVRNGYGSAY